MATLADVIRSKRKSGQSRTGSFFGSLKDKLKEKVDPRQIFNQTGILTSLFPSLKAYKAKGVGEETGKMIQRRTAELATSPQSMGGGMDLSVIEQNTKISAVNSMALPGLSRDINVMRQNISKLVKVVGLKSETKADRFFKNSSEREKEYESKFKTRPKLEGKNTSDNDEEKSKGFLGSLLSIVGGLIKAVTSTIKSVVGTLFSIIKGLVTTIFTGLKTVLVTILTSLFGLFKVAVVKLLASLGKVFSLMGAGRLLGIIGGLLFSPAGLVILAGSIAAALIKMAFINDEEKQKLFLNLDDLVKSGNASPEQIELHAELASKGFRKDPRALQMDLTKPSDFTAISSMKEELQRKPGDKDYKNDEEIKEIFGVDRATLQLYIEGGARGSLRDAEQRLKNIEGASLEPLSGESESSGIPRNSAGQAVPGQTLEQIDQTHNKQSAIANAQAHTSRIFAPELQQNSQDARGQSVGVKSSIFINSAKDAGSNFDITSIDLPKQSTLSPNSGGVHSSIPSVMNTDRPYFITGFN